MKKLILFSIFALTAVLPGYSQTKVKIINIQNSIINPNVGIHELTNKLSFSMSQNFPNPVKGSTNIRVNMLNADQISLDITNILGQKEISISRDFSTAGDHNLSIDAGNLSPGVYFYTVKIGNESITKKMIVE